MIKFGNNGEPIYLAIIGDIRDSRQASDRVGLQKDLERALDIVNRRLADRLAAGFLMTLGDEFQGLLSSPPDLMDALVTLEDTLSFTAVRYGAGRGTLSTELKEQAVGMDGPCFHHARSALGRSKERKRSFTVEGFGDRQDAILNGMLGLIAALRSGWTKKQADIVARVRRAGTQKEVAMALGVSPSVVSEALSATHYAEVTEAERAVTGMIGIFESTFGSGAVTG